MENANEIVWADLIRLPVNYAKLTAVIRDSKGGETQITGILRSRTNNSFINIGGIYTVRQKDLLRLYHHQPVRS